jgi:hypothetical protein
VGLSPFLTPGFFVRAGETPLDRVLTSIIIDFPARYLFRPTANTLCADRTYITLSESAGVAINNSPIEFVPRFSNFRPAAITSMSPSSFDK